MTRPRGSAMIATMFMVMLIYFLCVVMAMQARENARLTVVEAERTRHFFVAKACVNQAVAEMMESSGAQENYTTPRVDVVEGVQVRVWVAPDANYPNVLHVHAEATSPGLEQPQHFTRTVVQTPLAEPAIYIEQGGQLKVWTDRGGLTAIPAPKADMVYEMTSPAVWSTLAPVGFSANPASGSAFITGSGVPSNQISSYPEEYSPGGGGLSGAPLQFLGPYTADYLGNLYAVYQPPPDREPLVYSWPSVLMYNGETWKPLGPVPAVPDGPGTPGQVAPLKVTEMVTTGEDRLYLKGEDAEGGVHCFALTDQLTGGPRTIWDSSGTAGGQFWLPLTLGANETLDTYALTQVGSNAGTPNIQYVPTETPPEDVRTVTLSLNDAVVVSTGDGHAAAVLRTDQVPPEVYPADAPQGLLVIYHFTVERRPAPEGQLSQSTSWNLSHVSQLLADVDKVRVDAAGRWVGQVGTSVYLNGGEEMFPNSTLGAAGATGNPSGGVVTPAGSL
ncbi:MAG: hypothetical protein AB1758_14330 [Candidatus Eremiobacterota bacterium]